MTKRVLLTCLLVQALLLVPVFAQDEAAAKEKSTAVLETEAQKVSYALGIQFSQTPLQLQEMLDLDLALVLQAMQDSFAEKEPALTPEEMTTILTAAQQTVRTKMEQKQQEESAANLKEGEAFLEANKAKEGVVTTESGLQYKIITKGTGPVPTAADTIRAHYTGTLLDGTEFDSSVKRGKPLEIGVGRVVPGWQEALQLMPVGSKWELYIPAGLAYGLRGSPPVIPPNATLIFEMELLEIVKQDPAAAGSQTIQLQGQ